MLSMRWNWFPVCSACDEISSPYAQWAIKFVPCMLSMDCTCKKVHILPLAEHVRKFVPRMLSMRWNWFRVCSACDKIVSAYALHTHAISFENESKIPNKNANFAFKFWKQKCFGYLSKKIWFRVCSVTAEMFEHQNSGENRRKRCIFFFSKIYEGHIRIWFRSKKNSKLSHACVPLTHYGRRPLLATDWAEINRVCSPHNIWNISFLKIFGILICFGDSNFVCFCPYRIVPYWTSYVFDLTGS